MLYHITITGFRKDLFQRLILLNKRFSSCGCYLNFNNFYILPLTSKRMINPVKRGNPATVSHNYVRHNSDEHGPPSEKLPPMMDFPKFMYPSVIKMLKNFITINFIIRPYFDIEFNLRDFILGSEKAVEVVSRKISEGDFNSLRGLVSPHVISTLQRTTGLFTLSQRHEIAVNKDDIYFSFPYQIGIIFDGDNEEKRFVEITAVYHVLRGWAAMKERGEKAPINMGMLPEYQQRISVCNYKFIREYTKGVESDWTINLVSHFKPIDDKGL